MTTAQDKMGRAMQAGRDWEAQNHADGGVCDFCCHLLSERPIDVATYVLDRDIATQLLGIDDSGVGVGTYVADPYWAACADCDAIIQLKDPVALAAHVVMNRDVERTGWEPGLDEFHRRNLVQLYERFFAANPRREVPTRPS